MKKNSITLFTALTKDEFLGFTNEVKETIAFDTTVAGTKVFTSAQLWNIQRQGRLRTNRRFL